MKISRQVLTILLISKHVLMFTWIVNLSEKVGGSTVKIDSQWRFSVWVIDEMIIEVINDHWSMMSTKFHLDLLPWSIGSSGRPHTFENILSSFVRRKKWERLHMIEVGKPPKPGGVSFSFSSFEFCTNLREAGSMMCWIFTCLGIWLHVRSGSVLDPPEDYIDSNGHVIYITNAMDVMHQLGDYTVLLCWSVEA